METEIITKFIDLSEGKLSESEWKLWFIKNEKTIETFCGRTAFLKMKPKESFSDKRNAYLGQLAIIDWLKSKNIKADISEIYEKGWKKEFEDFCKSEKEKEIELRKTVETNFSYLKEIYPKFFKQLSQSYSNSDTIEQGKNIDTITNKEKEFSIKFPEDLTEFYRNISKLEFEGLSIDFDELSLEIINDKKYLVLGEYWKYGDGDKLLCDVESYNILVFAHEFNLQKIIKQTNTFREFVEKEIVKYLKEYEN